MEMKDVPQISVIMPIYKAEEFLETSVNSVLKQTFTDWELLLVDDGSPDASGRLCDEWAAKDSRIRAFHKKNGGTADARNYGLDRCRGEWIAFLDSDDWMKPRMLETMYGLVREYNVPLAVCNFWRHSPGKICKQEDTFQQVQVLDWDDAFQLCNANLGLAPAVWDQLVHRSVYQSLRFVKSCVIEDVDIYYRVFYNAKKLVYTPEPLYNYNCTNENSKTYCNKYPLEYVLASRRMSLFVAEKGAKEEIRNHALNVYWWKMFDVMARMEGKPRTKRFYQLRFLAWWDAPLVNKPFVLEQYRIQRKALCKGYAEFLRCRKEHGYY